MSNRKVLLMILDGWGIGDGQKGDVIAQVHPAYISEMTRKYPHAQLRTDGENVGLPDGQMGNSEVGHLNIGAGRVVYQDLVKINRACRDDSILKNPEIVKAFEYAKSNGVSVHLMGLVSDGGVHSSLDHLLKLTDIADKYGIEALFFHKLIDSNRFADDDICLHLYTERLYIFNLRKHYAVLRKTEFRNTVYKYSACFMQRFKNSYIISELSEVSSTSKSRRT